VFKKVLIANRGEIALRIIRACRDLGIKTVAVYSTADRDSLHVKHADESYCIGNPAPSDSYLKRANIITIAELTNTDAIHPGVGFLAEDAQFAEICEAHKITFIGPSVQNLMTMGDKVEAREAMSKAGLKLVPGSRNTRQGIRRSRKKGIVENDKDAAALAEKVGYPVGIKAVAGGGGRGIRIAHNSMSLINLFHTAKAEAESSFGNGDVYIEKWIRDARHIEVQVLGDHQGNLVHLGERECSIQRKRQKLVEEAPSPSISDKVRQELLKVAVKAARSVGYVNAGTVEFIVDENDQFYFLEMNSRIQVEHTISEMITGIDIVKEQIRLAAGEPLGYGQSSIDFYGHAIECRINAEDPNNDFSPSPGKINRCLLPGGIGIRLDTHIYSGYVVPSYYDSLVGKLIAHGKDRTESIARMRRALAEFEIDGIHTTIPLHTRILRNSRFLKAEVYTNFLESRI